MPKSPSASASNPNPGRSNSRPLQAAVLLSGAFLLSRLSGFAQQVIINALLERDATDAYIAAFALPDVVNYVVAGGAMSVTFIPIFTQLREGQNPRDAWRFFSTIATLMGLVLSALIVLCVIFAAPLTALFSPGLLEPNTPQNFARALKLALQVQSGGFPHPPRSFELAVEMTRIMLPAQMFFYLGGMIIGVLNAHKRFGASGYTGVLYRTVSILAGVALFVLTHRAVGFAWGILIGAFCGNFLLPLWASLVGPRDERLRFWPSLEWKMPGVRRFFLNALPIMLGVSLPVIDQIVVKFFGSGLYEGALTHLAYGNRFMLVPLGIVAQAASVAAFPFLASDSAAQDWKSFAEFLRNGLRRLMFLTLPLSVSLILIAQPLLSLFRFGKFNAWDVHQSSIAFAFYCVGLFAWTGQQLAARGFYALQDTKTPTLIGSGLALAFCGLCQIVVWQGWSVAGLAFATSIGATAQFVGVTLALDGRLKQGRYNAPLQLNYVLGTLLRTGAACVLMGLAGLAMDALAWQVLGGGGKGADLARLLLVSLAAWGAFVAAAKRFRIPEFFWVRDKLLKRARRSR